MSTLKISENIMRLRKQKGITQEALVKKYYSCYPFLLQIGVLWLNHYMLADGKERQAEVLGKLQELCTHILENCSNLELCSDARGIRASADLFCGRPKEAIDGIRDLLDPKRVLNQSDWLLMQAYLANGEPEEADSFAQASLYLHLLMLVGDSTYFLAMHMQEKEICEETIKRIDAVIGAYHLDELHPNVTAGYHYQVAVYAVMSGDHAQALRRLQQYAGLVNVLMDNGMKGFPEITSAAPE